MQHPTEQFVSTQISNKAEPGTKEGAVVSAVESFHILFDEPAAKFQAGQELSGYVALKLHKDLPLTGRRVISRCPVHSFLKHNTN